MTKQKILSKIDAKDHSKYTHYMIPEPQLTYKNIKDTVRNGQTTLKIKRDQDSPWMKSFVMKPNQFSFHQESIYNN